MSLINKRVSVNTFIHENINDAFDTVQLVADNLILIGIVAAEIEANGLSPLVYTKIESDALFAPIGNIYSRADAESTFATILDFHSTGITDNATETVIYIDSNNNIGIHKVPVDWFAPYAAIELGGAAALFTSKELNAVSLFTLANNICVDVGGNLLRKTIGAASRYDQIQGQHKFSVTPLGNLFDATLAVADTEYFIEFVNDTDFTLIGAASNTVGLLFTATGPATGTGIISSNSISPTVAMVIEDSGLVDITKLKFTDTTAIFTSTEVNDAINEIFPLLVNTGVVSGSSGASRIGVKDAAGNFVGINIETVLAEIIADYAAVTTGNGASKIGVQDSPGNFVAATVETILEELHDSKVGITGDDLIEGHKVFNGQVTHGNTTTFHKGVDVVSSTVLTTAIGNYFDVTGTTNISSIATKGVGTVLKLHFNQILTLIHSANLSLPGGGNLETVSGDEVELVEYTTGQWRLTNYVRAASASIQPNQNVTDLFKDYGSGVDGQKTISVYTTLSNHVYQYTDFTIDAGVSAVINTAFCIIKATGIITINGTINARGGDIIFTEPFDTFGEGMSGGAGGGGGGGRCTDDFEGQHSGNNGYAGANSFLEGFAPVGGAGGTTGLAYNGSNGFGPSLAKQEIAEFFLTGGLGTNAKGGRGGDGAIVPGYSYVPKAGGNGGKGGCTLILYAPKIIINATGVLNLGGQEGQSGGPGVPYFGGGGGGGAGAGGVLIIMSPDYTNSGNIDLTSGNPGAGGIDGGFRSWAGAQGGYGAPGWSKIINPNL